MVFAGGTWSTNLPPEPPPCGDNTTIEIQKSILGDYETTKRVLAHELAHHEDDLVNEKPEFERLGFMAYRMLRKFRDGHGANWQAIAARFNARYGDDFVTKTSDQSYVVESETKPFFVLFYQGHDGKVRFQQGSRISPKQKEYLARCAEVNAAGKQVFKLVKSTDSFFHGGALIGSRGGWSNTRDAAGLEKIKKQWEEGEDLLPEFAQAKVAAAASAVAVEPPIADRQTSAFDAWFSGSKVVDQDGNPLKVYHGTGADIAEFDFAFTGNGNDQHGSGFYFTSNPDEASGYASEQKDKGGTTPNVVAAYLAIKKPIVCVDGQAQQKLLTRSQINKIMQASPIFDDVLTNFGDVEYEGRAKVMNLALDTYSQDDNLLHQLHLLANDFYPDRVKEFNEAVRKATGYDGVIAKFGGKQTVHYIAWFPDQIKSAIGNSGTFDPKNNSITAAVEAPEESITETPAFEAWFKGSKIVDSEGNPLPVIHGTDAEFDTFDRSKSKSGPSKFGFWFTTDKNLSELFGANQMVCYLRMRNPYKITSSKWNEIRDLHAKDTEWFERWRERIKSAGHDGLWVLGEKFISSRGWDLSDPSVFAVFEPSQIKSVKNSGAFDEAKQSIYAAMPPVEEDAEWAREGMKRAKAWIAEEAKAATVSDDQLGRLISAAFNHLVNVEFKGDPVKEVGSDLKFRVGGAYLDSNGTKARLYLRLSPGLGPVMGQSAKNDWSWWDAFAKKAIEVLVHERTHALQFNRWRTQKNKQDPSGSSYEETVTRHHQQYQAPQSEEQSAYGEVVKYLGDQVEIAAHARQAVQELRSSGMTDREVFVWIRRKSGWSTLARRSQAFQSYYRVYMFNPHKGVPIFRKFLTNVMRALSKDDTAPISREDYELAREFNGPEVFPTKPNAWSLDRKKQPRAAAVNSGSEPPKWLYDHAKKQGISPDLVPSAWESIQQNRIELAKDNLALAREKGFEVTPNDDLVLYHGTRSGTAIRNSGYLRPGSFLTAIKADAERYAGMAQRKGRAEVLRLEVYPGYGTLQGNGYFVTREPVPVRNVKEAAGPKQYNFATTCVSAKGEDIEAMVDQATEVSYNTWFRNCNGAEDMVRSWGNTPKLKDDPNVSYYRSMFRGLPCYYVRASGIEHVWVKGHLPYETPEDEGYDIEELKTASEQKRAAATIRAYHGTRAGDFDAFRPHYRKGEQLGFGMHFAAEKDLALRYALDDNTARRGGQPMLYTVDLTIHKMLKADAIVSEGSPEFALAEKLAGKRLWTQKDENGVRCVYMQNVIDASSAQRAEKLIREAGYDGIEYKAKVISMAAPGMYHKHADGVSYLVFEPSQVQIVGKEPVAAE